MTGPGSWLRQARERFGERAVTAVILLALVLVAVVPLAAFPAARCEVFGAGCRVPLAEVRGDAPRAPDALDPATAAAAGSYVALGDSYSAGVGAEATVADQNPLARCHRTSKAYYHAVAAAFPFKGGGFYACSGATVNDVLHGRFGEPPQIGRVDANTTLVTLSIGGNDIGFSKIIAGCVVKLPWSGSCTKQGGDIARRMAALRTALPDLLDQITDRAPRARVLVMGYPHAFSEVNGAAGDNISVAEQRWLNAQTHDLNEIIKQAAVEADDRVDAAGGAGSVEFVDAYGAFAGHEAGSGDPYMNGLAVNLSALEAEPRSFHPTARGQQALAALFIEQVKKGPGRPLHQYR
ncbi:SGNH/GDSL hydrolase family protein [Actinomadura atramentaria]|uniref:SGNH/GDSL hydrolase family protein n=1 Tax=Actinomadura atramentaria TaxID=1990 RepID=UPI000361E078|nr:SGNH/GDSL hydrolase family protein [Actinomadura atramentaria]